MAKYLKTAITEEIKRHFAHDNESYQVEKFHACRLNPENHQLELLVEWRGFTEDDNSWEPLKKLYEDVPELVNFQKKLQNDKSAYAEEVEDFIRLSKSNWGSTRNIQAFIPLGFNAEF